MADPSPDHEQLAKMLASSLQDFQTVLKHHLALTIAMQQYLAERPDFDAARYRALLEECRADGSAATLALARAGNSLQEWLQAYVGPVQ